MKSSLLPPSHPNGLREPWLFHDTCSFSFVPAPPRLRGSMSSPSFYVGWTAFSRHSSVSATERRRVTLSMRNLTSDRPTAPTYPPPHTMLWIIQPQSILISLETNLQCSNIFIFMGPSKTPKICSDELTLRQTSLVPQLYNWSSWLKVGA